MLGIKLRSFLLGLLTFTFSSGLILAMSKQQDCSDLKENYEAYVFYKGAPADTAKGGIWRPEGGLIRKRTFYVMNDGKVPPLLVMVQRQ
jgi:hypothetical protein